VVIHGTVGDECIGGVNGAKRLLKNLSRQSGSPMESLGMLNIKPVYPRMCIQNSPNIKLTMSSTVLDNASNFKSTRDALTLFLQTVYDDGVVKIFEVLSGDIVF
jgi:hypothetical protein